MSNRKLPMTLDAMSAERRENLRRLVQWFARDHGISRFLCHSNEAIRARLGLATLQAATDLMRSAARASLIALEAQQGGAARYVRLLPAGVAYARADAPRSSSTLKRMDAGFGTWLATAQPGARRTYFSGHLAEARQRGGAHGQSAAMLVAADEATAAAGAGLVLLTQRRADLGEVDYIAIRTARALPEGWL